MLLFSGITAYLVCLKDTALHLEGRDLAFVQSMPENIRRIRTKIVAFKFFDRICHERIAACSRIWYNIKNSNIIDSLKVTNDRDKSAMAAMLTDTAI